MKLLKKRLEEEFRLTKKRYNSVKRKSERFIKESNLLKEEVQNTKKQIFLIFFLAITFAFYINLIANIFNDIFKEFKYYPFIVSAIFVSLLLYTKKQFTELYIKPLEKKERLLKKEVLKIKREINVIQKKLMDLKQKAEKHKI